MRKQPPDLEKAAQPVDKAAAAIEPRLSRETSLLVRAYGDLHIALDQMHKLSLA